MREVRKNSLFTNSRFMNAFWDKLVLRSMIIDADISLDTTLSKLNLLSKLRNLHRASSLKLQSLKITSDSQQIV